MKIIKYMEGLSIELIFDKIKKYDRYNLYQVSKLVNGVKMPLYKECFSKIQLAEIAKNRYKIRVEYDV